jgi:hypothetical protein
MTNSPQCYACVHFDRDAPSREFRCDAFPDGIPVPIQSNKHDHSKPYPGDHGILYEQIRPGPRAQVAVQAILEGWRKPGPRSESVPTPPERRKSKERGRSAR